MSEQPTIETEILMEPVGVRILGDKDPRTLSEEEFEHSPDTLYHGATKDFEFSPKFDYESTAYGAETAGSTTIGVGLYTSKARAEAENYAIERGIPNEQFVIITFLPHQARMLDLRSNIDPSMNASFPKDLAQKWRTRYTEYLKTRKQQPGPLGIIIAASQAKYSDYLDRVMALPSANLRILLETAPAPALKSRNRASPPWTGLFSHFMQQEGFDGVIYNEGGEGREARPGASYVFYNLNKVGTHKSWQKTNPAASK